ncbi:MULTISPECIES: hypothetical protein [Streptomyces]|uniref:Uncharacterized protein n=1 Tax=Streptomyces thermoviolaceus subsp. thermoviolaceus TaxID=66860 RepID=A0ABX0YX32_STRTL|nr:hypothetical protein [Streptomyces thermoviolaceus]NJP16582.1 hypothetical protein [Streptomyces thermoviolaceus subsp. thermoviolaceus]GGV82087.1 hypothetical protein GCM10010499_47220 [Streptomyces thermoviolaceus subsp. apingens]GHB03550.1 hypothetical protein GCM10010512_38730 [Streptomyces thermoviolaceus subsp. thermoviolaceus]
MAGSGAVGVPGRHALDWFAEPRATGRRALSGPYVGCLCSDTYSLTLSEPVRCAGRFAGVAAAGVCLRDVEAPSRCRCRGRCPPPRIWFSARARVAASADPAHLTGSLTRGPDFAAVLRTARTATWAGLTLVPCAGLPLVLVLDERHPRAGHGTSTTPSAT